MDVVTRVRGRAPPPRALDAVVGVELLGTGVIDHAGIPVPPGVVGALGVPGPLAGVRLHRLIPPLDQTVLTAVAAPVRVAMVWRQWHLRRVAVPVQLS